jgi:hypothetical protein
MNKDEIKKLISNFVNESEELGLIVNPIFEKYTLEKKEILEVCQIGKFVYKVDSEIQIIEKPQPPAPDFILRHKSKLIGLEHTRILTKNASKYLRLVNLVEYSSKVFDKKYPNLTISAAIEFKNDELEYSQKEKKVYATLIADLVYQMILDEYIEFPEFITDIRILPHSKVTFYYKEKNWQPKPLTLDRLKEEIQKKEQKIPNYKTSDINILEYWLVLLIGSLSSVSYELNEAVNYKTDSMFDRVYLMSDSTAKIIRVK